MTTIAVVEDRAFVATFVRKVLESEGYEVRAFGDGGSALEALSENPVDLAILDLQLPDMDGMELLRQLRKSSDLPVIILTGVRREELHQLKGFQGGADDYVLKPITRRRLAERVRTILRRATPLERRDEAREQNILQQGDLRMNKERRDCYWKGARVEDLPESCFQIMWALAQKPGERKTFAELTKSGKVNSVDDAIVLINKQFKVVDPNFDAIQNIRGVGFVFEH